MTLKTNLRNILFVTLSIASLRAEAYNAFECLRDLMPITDRATVQTKRGDVEEPFIVDGKYVVFPEISNGTVTGFFFYGAKSAAYYDAAEVKGKIKSIGDMSFRRDEGIYDLVAQPAGLETVTVHYLPGFRLAPTGGDGPVVLGASVLPVVGAFVSRPDIEKLAYNNPKSFTDSAVKKWMSEHMTERRPASVDDIVINSTILKLKTLQVKSGDALMKPLRQELKLRKAWVQSHNLDEKAFKQLTLTMEGSCKEP